MSSSSASQNHMNQRDSEHNTSDNNNGNTSHNAFFQDGDYRGFGSLHGGPQDPSIRPGWHQIPDQYHVPQNMHAQYGAAWPDLSNQIHHNVSSNSPSGNSGGYYPGFNQSTLPYQNGGLTQTQGYPSFQVAQYDPRIGAPSTSKYDLQSSSYTSASSPTNTIAPEALHNRPQLPSQAQHSVPKASLPANVPSGEISIPKMPLGEPSGRFVVTSMEDLEKATNIKRLHNFLGVCEEPFNLQITKSTIPTYFPRKSRNEIRKLLANDKDLATKITKKATKALTGALPKPKKPEPSVSQGAVRPKREASGSSSDSSTDDDSSSDSEDEDAKPPLPNKRPETAIDAVKYDTVKALWRSPRYLALDRDDIANGISAFWEIVRTIRDRWKSDTSAVKQAEEAKQVNELPLLKERVSIQRNMVTVALRTALDQGHADIIENFGGHLAFMQSLAQFMQDRAVNSDYSGEFPQIILQLLSKCLTLTEGALEKTSIGKLLPRFVKRGDEKIKSLAKRIQDNAVTASKKKKQDAAAKPTTSHTETASSTKAIDDGNQKQTTAGVKRPFSGSSGSPQPQKKIAASNGDRASPSKPISKSTSTPDAKSTNSTTAAAKPKVQPVVAKPSGFFSSLQSAKKSTTSNTTSSTAQVKPSIPATSTSNAQSKSATSASSFFASTMASLTKPKEAEPTAKLEDSKPLETEEEKAKRLRKEQRRKLRVSFKPEANLVEIRYFTHDPEEELGHDSNQVLDADDVKSEGQMFKKHHNDDLMDIDDDDEEYSPEDMEEVVKEYREPSLIDFSVIEKEERERLYEPHGGGLLKPDCPEKTIQEQREASTLMAIYTASDDVPSTPKEPTAESSEDIAAPRDFGEPPQSFMSRMKTAQEEPVDIHHNQMSASNLATGFGAFTQTSQQPHEQSSGPAPLSELEKIFAQFANQGQQQAPAQAPMMQSQPQQPQAAQTPNMSAIFAALGGGQQNPGQGQAQQSNQYQAPSAPPTAAPDLSAILASLSGGGLQLPAAPQMQSSAQTQNNAAQNQWYNQQQYNQPGQSSYDEQQSGYTQQQSYHQPGNNAVGGASAYPFENEERRRLREAGDTDMYDERPSNPAYGGGGNKKGGKQWGKGGGGGGGGGGQGSGSAKERNPNKPTPFKVVPCKYWKEGKCRKGSDCTFLHDTR